MENPKFLKGKVFSVVKVALLGCAIFVALTLATIRHVLPLDVSVLIALPSVIVIEALGLPDNALSSGLFALAVNALVGALTFAVIGTVWQLLTNKRQ